MYLWLKFVLLRNVTLLRGVICQVLRMNLVLCKKQRRRFRFLPVKLCTIKVNIFLYCEFICKFSFSNFFFSTHIKYRRRVHVLK